MSEYRDLDEFYTEEDIGPARARSAEVDFGWWAEPAPNGPGRLLSTGSDARLSWVVDTGEVYVFRARPYGIRARVEVLGTVKARDELERILEGWEYQAAKVTGPGLAWAIERLSTLGSRPVKRSNLDSMRDPERTWERGRAREEDEELHDLD